MGKRGQITIYVIIAMVIVVAGVLIYFLFPQVKEIFGAEFSPSSFLQTCLEPTVDEGILLLSSQGGYSEPEGFVLYKGKKVKYLCYTSQYYVTCNVQQPLLKAHFEEELEKMVSAKAEECFAELKEEYSRRGYDISGGERVSSQVELTPGEIRVLIESELTVSKEITQAFSSFEIVERRKVYELLMIATSIIDYESTYGDSAVDLYHQYYPNLRIQKNKMSDSSTVYVLSDVVSGDEFVFASRSLAWPAGYGRETV